MTDDPWHYDDRTSKHGAYMGGADFVQCHANAMLARTVPLRRDGRRSAAAAWIARALTGARAIAVTRGTLSRRMAVSATVVLVAASVILRAMLPSGGGDQRSGATSAIW
jgi:hypothetical protein